MGFIDSSGEPPEMDWGSNTTRDPWHISPPYRYVKEFAHAIPKETSAGWIWRKPYYLVAGRLIDDQALRDLDIPVVRKHNNYVLGEEDFLKLKLAIGEGETG